MCKRRPGCSSAPATWFPVMIMVIALELIVVVTAVEAVIGGAGAL